MLAKYQEYLEIMEKTYIYQPNKVLILLTLVIFGVFTGLTIHEALTIEGSASFRRGFILNEGQAKILFWALSGIFTYVFILGLVGLIRSFGPARHIKVSEKFLITPKNAISSKILRIPLNGINSINVTKAAKKEILNIKYQGGRVSISEAVFENEFKFSSFKSELTSAIANLKIAKKTGNQGAQKARASS